MDSQAELAKLTTTPRTTISAYLRLRDPDPEIQSFALDLDDADERLEAITEVRLRPLLKLEGVSEQRRRFGDLLGTGVIGPP